MTSSARSSLAGEPIPRPVRSLLVRVRDQVFEVDDVVHSRFQRAGYYAVRLIWLTVRAFFRDRIQIRAASLAFSSLLAIVPALAVLFWIARATGLFTEVREGTIEPFLDEMLGTHGGSGGVETLRTWAHAVLLLVESTDVSGLGVLGVVVLALALTRLLFGVEESFRHVFELRGPRRIFWLRLRAFAMVGLVTPLGFLYAAATASLTHGTWLTRLFEAWVPFAAVRGALIFVLPPLTVALVLYVLYRELPETRVSRRSAMFGALWAAVFWYGVQLIHVRSQIGLARWNAIYSGFGAFPVLLASIQISWVIVLIGAQLVAAHQHSPSLKVLARGAPRDHAALQAAAMRIVLALTRADGPMEPTEVAKAASADLPTVRSVLEALAAHGIVTAIERAIVSARADDSLPASLGEARAYILAGDPRAIRSSDVLDALERSAGSAELPWHDADPHIRAVLTARRAAAASSAENLTLDELTKRTTDEG